MVSFLCEIKAAHLRPYQWHTLNKMVKAELTKRGLQLKAAYILHIESASHLDRLKINKWISKVIREQSYNIHPMIGKYYARHTKVVFSSNSTIKDIVNTKALKDWNMDEAHPGDCKCKDFPDLINEKTGHVYLKASDLPDSHAKLREILSISSKNPVFQSNRNYLGIQMSHIKAFLRSINLTPTWNDNFNDELVDLLFRPHKQRQPALTYQHIIATIKKYKGLEYIQLDKNTGTWAVSCKAYYRQLHLDYFTKDPHYEIITSPISVIKEQLEERYKDLELSELAPPRKKWELGQARLLPKDKDIHKLRPLVSYYKFIGRNAGRIVARALSLIIRKAAKKCKTMDLFATSELASKLKHWNNIIDGNQDLTLVKFDLKNQFSDLDKSRVLVALKKVMEINGGHEWYSISKRRMEKKRDVNRKKNRRDFYILDAATIRSYVWLELENPYFEVGGKIFKQKNGLPMGGLVSAGLAVIDSIYVEHCNQHLWKTTFTTSSWFRFRDDILAIVNHKCNEIDVQYLLARLQLMYGPQLEVVLEEYSSDHVQFLEYYVATKAGKLAHWDRNKNVDWIYNKLKRVVRFPEVDAEHHRQIYRGIMVGGFRRAHRNGSTSELRQLAAFQMAQEWVEKGYPAKWIADAAYIANIEEPKTIKEWTRWYQKQRRSDVA
jgi:hypothetical protein